MENGFLYSIILFGFIRILSCVPSFLEQLEGKRISSFTISQNGNVIFKKTTSKKTISICVFTILITLFLTAYCIYYYYIEKQYTVCKTKSCLLSSVSLMNCMNETVEPCEDFYEFACGMFEINYPSCYETEENSWITIMTLKVKHRVKKFLVQQNEDYEPEAVHKTRQFYKTCINAKKDTLISNYDPLRNIWKKLGLDANYLNDSTPLEIELILAKTKIYFNMGIYFDINIDDDPRNSSRSLLIINEHRISDKFIKRNNIKTKNTIENEFLQFTKYFELIVNKLLNNNLIQHNMIDSNDLVNTTKELNYFEDGLLKIVRSSYISEQNIPEIFTLKQLQNLTDLSGKNFKFDWTLYLRELFRDTEPNIYKQLISNNSDSIEILISNREYFTDLFILLNKTPTKIIKMSVITHVLIILENLFPSVESLSKDYCFTLTTELFGMVTGYSMINTLDKSSKDALYEMADNIKWSLREMIKKVSWMDDETKNATLRKLTNTNIYYGYPNNYTNILNYLFENLNITENHIENMISISTFNAKKYWKYLLENNKDWENVEWTVTPDEVNAYNYNSMNAFFMPAAILQFPLYLNGIQALNYGATGSTIGHELSHNYDNTGRLYNELGNVVEWWTKKSYEEYTKKTECFVNYYNDIKVVWHNETFEMNGKLTLDENIADVTGLKEAYFAYQRYINKHGQEPKLPGLEHYSHEQLFFLAYANQYCYYDNSEMQFNSLNTHSPNMIRVRGVLALSPEFAKAWSCPVGTPMNPKKEKCQIW